MTDQEINVAIAEACGWKIDPDFCGVTNPQGVHRFRGYDSIYTLIPNYCSDLNAMRDAESQASHRDVTFGPFYVAALYNVLGIDQPAFEREARPNDFCFACLHAAARQRAEAFLRVHGSRRKNEP